MLPERTDRTSQNRRAGGIARRSIGSPGGVASLKREREGWPGPQISIPVGLGG